MQRRIFIKSVLETSAIAFGFIAPLLSTSAFAVPPSGIEASKVPLTHVHVPADGSKVIFFFDFSCNFSAAYHIPMLNWARTAPPEIKTEFIPVINMADQRRRKELILAANGYYAGVAACKTSAQLEKFVTEVYNNRQIKGMPLMSANLWKTSTKNAGVSHESFLKAINSSTEKTMRYALSQFNKYKLTATPTVAVAGQYTLNPDQANGDPELFFNLVNGLASNFILI